MRSQRGPRPPPLPPCSSPSSPLRYGLSKKDLSLTVTANVSTYTPADLCDAPANSTGWKEPGTINSGVMTGLEPNTRYYYVVGDEVRGLLADAAQQGRMGQGWPL